MISAILLAVLIIAVGSELSERVRVRQEELILEKLPQSQAVEYYDRLRRRVRKIRVMRGIVLVAFVILMYAYKRIFLAGNGPAAGV